MATAKTKKTETPTEPKEWNLRPGQYLLFNNDKGDNAKRPDLRGQVCLPDGTQAQISAWKKWSITNTMQLEASIQVMDGDGSKTIGRLKLNAVAHGDNSKGLAMVGEADVECHKPLAVTLYRHTDKNGKTYFSGYLNEIQPQRVDVLVDEPPVEDDFEHDEPRA